MQTKHNPYYHPLTLVTPLVLDMASNILNSYFILILDIMGLFSSYKVLH